MVTSLSFGNKTCNEYPQNELYGVTYSVLLCLLQPAERQRRQGNGGSPQIDGSTKEERMLQELIVMVDWPAESERMLGDWGGGGMFIVD